MFMVCFIIGQNLKLKKSRYDFILFYADVTLHVLNMYCRMFARFWLFCAL